MSIDALMSSVRLPSLSGRGPLAAGELGEGSSVMEQVGPDAYV